MFYYQNRKSMNRLYVICPKCETEVLVTSVEWQSVEAIPAFLSIPAKCKQCGSAFGVHAGNAIIAPANNTEKTD
jgi:hypothetical protein